jgi:tRNA uridine 5-carboxymethylaminomethyl modification enzyme
VLCKKNGILKAKCVVITSGTYMNPLTFSGTNFKKQGPLVESINNENKVNIENCEGSFFLSENLQKHGLKMIRLKTGTPPRIFKKSIDFSVLEEQLGTKKQLSFVHYKPKYIPFKKQEKCFLTYTNENTHKIIRENLNKSPMYSGLIKSTGPLYCPSIEDKVTRFSEKIRHQLFIEPESLSLDTYYLQGFSTALPYDIQEKMVKSIKGLENSQIQRYAYAIEYDAIIPTQLYPTLETKLISNLYFAGQVNGTSGYEEAAGQGILAGINAGLKAKGKKELVLKRNESYIGVMIDDITTKGVTDPYRLLTSRAEFRLFLRNDNAQERLIKYGYEIGLVKKEVYKKYQQDQKIIQTTIEFLKQNSLNKKLIKKYGLSCHSLFQLLKNPKVKLKEILSKKKIEKIPKTLIEKIEILVKYEGYIKSQQKNIERIEKFQNISLQQITDYKPIKNLSLEAISKLNKIKPLSLEQAQRIPGITSCDIINIKFFLDKQKKENKK